MPLLSWVAPRVSFVNQEVGESGTGSDSQDAQKESDELNNSIQRYGN
ncbi:MAG: hypothetical protein IT209_13145 [Armatimonadetes bacterium]|nr:hypothetical protein [Armatimonadota bacterium]